ncbi:MAG: sensor domain-containing diguanylate cyclase [Anaerolineaceae bacterium]|nr:MAG: sensor domain-containing diguanylate cyclase [Anaerolineaceae bacterium]
MDTHSDEFHQALLDNLHDGVYYVDAKRRINYWNKGAERLTGYSREKMVGCFCFDNLLDHVTEDGKHLCTDGCPLSATMQDAQPREAEVHLRHADGHRVPVLVRTSPIFDDGQKVVGAVEVFSNNQSMFRMRRRVDQLEQDVQRDLLTGLGNRAFLQMKIQSALGEYRVHHIPFGVLFIDIDHFKSVNDTYGHPAGDLVIQNVARTLSAHLRDTDACGRWSGDEFVALLLEVEPVYLHKIADKLRAMVASSIVQSENAEICVTASVGAATAHENDTVESLIERADAQMYSSKLSGRNQVSVAG